MKLAPMILSSVLCLVASSSFAAKTAATYPATEEGPSAEVINSAPGARTQYAPPTAPVTPPARPAPITQTQTAAPAPTSHAQFDAVPNGQAEPLIRRLRLTEELVSKYGRAYDYRAMTVTELQTILAQLDAQAAQNTQYRARMNARSEIKRSLDGPSSETASIPAPAIDPSASLGSEAPAAQN